ncbi:unnamed protein product [Mytilus edulis]|uniref:Uncharacterized protein n=1 Tax=Mytilus edulis TaxID=6550 RepID=A0A8S3TEU0_MYTED|nr:unnamed protein product [Mytilus edulis]
MHKPVKKIILSCKCILQIKNDKYLSFIYRLEDDFNLKRSQSENEFEDLKGSRRGSGNVRRSFLQRRKHKRNNSKDSREFNSFSDASLNSDSVPQLDAVMQASVQVMEQGLADGTYIDYWQEDDHFVCIRVTSIHEISDKGDRFYRKRKKNTKHATKVGLPHS